jgi:hypothetical protein
MVKTRGEPLVETTLLSTRSLLWPCNLLCRWMHGLLDPSQAFATDVSQLRVPRRRIASCHGTVSSMHPF